MTRKILMAEPCGFCAGVRNALKLIDQVLSSSPGPVYVLRGLIHNSKVTEELRTRGCIFAENTAEIPENAVTVFGAHGVSLQVEQEALTRKLRVTDASCPLVKQLQQAAAQVDPDRELVLFGHRGHPEVEGVIGHAGTKKIHVIENREMAETLPVLKAPVFLVQTTLSHIEADEVRAVLQKRFPNLECGHGICNASLSRQQAVEKLAGECDLIIVVGSPHSSNANRLREAAEKQGCRAVLVDTEEEVDPALVENAKIIGVSAAASTPQSQIDAILAFLKSFPGKK